jgi:predicted kinase
MPRRAPLALAVTGRIASGKSTVARRLAEQLGATLLVADRIREGAVADLARDEAPVEARLHALERAFDDAVYAELLRRAADELGAGRSVVLDAAFPRRALRDQLRALAARSGAACRVVECRARDAVLRARLAARAAAGDVPLERWLALRDALDEQFEPCDEMPPAERLQLDTSGAAAESSFAAAAWLASARGG